MSPFYQIRFHSGETFEAFGDPAAMRAEVARFSASDVAGYERFMRIAEQTYKIGFEQLGDVPFTSWVDMARVLPEMVRLESYRSIYGLVAKHVKDDRLRFALSFHPLFVGGNPFNVTAIYGLISFLERRWGVHFAMGGTGSLVRGLVGLIEGQGNTIRYGAEVSAITVQGKRATGVRLASGEEIAADVVVSNADSAWTYRYLLPPEVRRRWTDRRIEKARYSMSLFLWYFGTRRQYPDVAHHTILLGPRYRELIEDIFERKVLAPDFSLYLHRPTATDPSLAPPGCDTFYVLSPVPNLEGNVDWAQRAEPYRQAVAQRLAETLLPDLESQVVTSRLVTPPDFQHRLLSFRGAAFGLEPVLMQSAWFRPHNRSEDVDRLYLVGAGTHPGAGLPGVLSSARILDTVVPDAATLA
jgi:phytoene desaturase